MVERNEGNQGGNVGNYERNTGNQGGNAVNQDGNAGNREREYREG